MKSYYKMSIFSFTYLLASFTMFLVGILALISFISPYWLQTGSQSYAEFTSIGVWEVCFNDYKNIQLFGRKYFDGCKQNLSEEMFLLRKWFLPDWMKLTQALIVSSFTITFSILLSILISLFTRLRDMFIFIIYITILTIILDALNILILLLFGVNSYVHEWTPEKAYTDNIHFSFSFWSHFLSLGFSFFATLLFLNESKSVLMNQAASVKSEANAIKA